jgi:hypothetical protein
MLLKVLEMSEDLRGGIVLCVLMMMTVLKGIKEPIIR